MDFPLPLIDPRMLRPRTYPAGDVGDVDLPQPVRAGVSQDSTESLPFYRSPVQFGQSTSNDTFTRPPASGDALDIKRVAGDYSSESSSGDIKTAAGVPLVTRQVPAPSAQTPSPSSTEDLPMPGRSPLNLPHWVSPRAAQGEADERSLVEPGAQYRAYEKVRDTRPEARQGSWGHLLAAGKGFVYGGLPGAAIGASSPQSIRDYEWRTKDIPRAEEAANIERGEEGRELAAGHTVAGMTGVDPWTGQPTEIARERTLNEGLRTDAQAERTHQNRIGNADREQVARERVAATAVQRAVMMRQKVPMAAVKGTSLEAYGDMVPPDKTVVPHWAQDANGMWVDLNSAKGPVQGKVSRDPNEMTPYQRASDARANDREDRADRRDAANASKEDERAKDHAEATRKQAQGKIEKYNRVRVQQNPRATPEQVETARREALAAAEEAEASHPDLLEGAEGTNGVPYVKWKGGKRPPPATVAPRSRTATPKRAADPLGIFN